MNSRIRLSRRRTPLTIFYKDRQIGEIFKYTVAPGFGLAVEGVYWSRLGKPARHGAATKAFATLREAIAAIEPTLRARRNLKRQRT